MKAEIKELAANLMAELKIMEASEDSNEMLRIREFMQETIQAVKQVNQRAEYREAIQLAEKEAARKKKVAQVTANKKKAEQKAEHENAAAGPVIPEAAPKVTVKTTK